jgi:hypothetical protein
MFDQLRSLPSVIPINNYITEHVAYILTKVTEILEVKTYQEIYTPRPFSWPSPNQLKN